MTQKSKKYRIPYLGSKAKHAEKLIAKMLEIKPNAKHFVDLFGGGGAMSFAALEVGLSVHYNEINAGMCNLVSFLKSHHGPLPAEFYDFVSRDQFKVALDKDDPLSQAIKCCYSFGNNCRTYLFSPKNEALKKLAHNVVVFRCDESLKKLNAEIEHDLAMPCGESINDRRLDFRRQINAAGKRLDLRQLELLEPLELLERLKITNLDFRSATISTSPDETVIYLDPPYRDKAKYNDDAHHSEIDLYMKKMKSAGYNCFLSEYTAPFECILEINTRSTLSSSSNTTAATERLFIN